MTQSYWDRLLFKRIGRRRALAAAGTGALAAAMAAACGGDDDSSTPADRSGFLASPTDQTKEAKRGGTLNIAGAASTATLEQSLGGSGSGGLIIPNLYSQLMKINLGTYDEVPQGVTEPDFAESFEISGDGLTITFKLRGAKFDDRPPTNGRVSDSGDVKYSWERWEAGNTRRQDLSNNVTKDAPVMRVETPDKERAVFKLAFPFAPFMAYMSSSFFPFIYPVEANGGYNTRGIARGTGAWRKEDSSPSGDAVLQRNPTYWDSERPYFDTLHIHDLTEATTILAQFQSGALDFNLNILQEDVLQLKKSNPNLVMYQRPFFAKGSGGVFFGRRQGSPFNDDRVRKALSMNLDRTLWGDTYSNRQKFEAEGLPVEVKWHAGAGPGYHWYLDPEKGEHGDAVKNLQHNPTEAHKLLQATGIPLPIRTIWQTTAANVNLGGATPQNEGMVGLMQQSGDFQFTTNVASDFTEYLAKVRDTGGNFDGIGIAFYNDHHDFDWTMFLKYHPTSTDFWMRIAGEDPKMTDFVNRQRREMDTKKREQIFQDFVKYDVGQMYYIPHYPADWKPYYIGQPWLGGWGWWQPYIEQYLQGPGQWYTNFWFDASKRPS
jgi:peptide/nickel transport system substrate-binding protein